MFSFMTTSFLAVFAILMLSNAAALTWFYFKPQAAANFLVWITFGKAERAPVISWPHQIGFYLALGAFYVPLMYVSFWATVAASVVCLIVMMVWRAPATKVNVIMVNVLLDSIKNYPLGKAV